MVEFNLDHDIW